MLPCLGFDINVCSILTGTRSSSSAHLMCSARILLDDGRLCSQAGVARLYCLLDTVLTPVPFCGGPQCECKYHIALPRLFEPILRALACIPITIRIQCHIVNQTSCTLCSLCRRGRVPKDTADVQPCIVHGATQDTSEHRAFIQPTTFVALESVAQGRAAPCVRLSDPHRHCISCASAKGWTGRSRPCGRRKTWT